MAYNRKYLQYQHPSAQCPSHATTAEIMYLQPMGSELLVCALCLCDHSHSSSNGVTFQRSPVGWFCLALHPHTSCHCSVKQSLLTSSRSQIFHCSLHYPGHCYEQPSDMQCGGWQMKQHCPTEVLQKAPPLLLPCEVAKHNSLTLHSIWDKCLHPLALRQWAELSEELP